MFPLKLTVLREYHKGYETPTLNPKTLNPYGWGLGCKVSRAEGSETHRTSRRESPYTLGTLTTQKVRLLLTGSSRATFLILYQ